MKPAFQDDKQTVRKMRHTDNIKFYTYVAFMDWYVQKGCDLFVTWLMMDSYMLKKKKKFS